MPVMAHPVGASVNWTGPNPVSNPGTGEPPVLMFTTPGTVTVNFPFTTVQWSDGFSLSSFAPGDPNLAYVV